MYRAQIWWCSLCLMAPHKAAASESRSPSRPRVSDVKGRSVSTQELSYGLICLQVHFNYFCVFIPPHFRCSLLCAIARNKHFMHARVRLQVAAAPWGASRAPSTLPATPIPTRQTTNVSGSSTARRDQLWSLFSREQTTYGLRLRLQTLCILTP